MMKTVDSLERPFRTPRQLSERWGWHEESVRRKIRKREIGAVHIGRRLLIPIEEIERIETDGAIKAVVRQTATQP